MTPTKSALEIFDDLIASTEPYGWDNEINTIKQALTANTWQKPDEMEVSRAVVNAIRDPESTTPTKLTKKIVANVMDLMTKPEKPPC